jgi:hypothetical protein
MRNRAVIGLFRFRSHILLSSLTVRSGLFGALLASAEMKFWIVTKVPAAEEDSYHVCRLSFYRLVT